MKVCSRDDRYSIEVQVPSFCEDQTASWVRIVNGVDKFVTESMLSKKEEDKASGKPTAEVRPGQKSTVTLPSVLQFGAQEYSDASSIRHTGLKGGSGKNGKNLRKYRHDS